MMNKLVCVALVGLFGASKAAAADPGGECAAADIIRAAYPGLIAEEDLQYLAAQACPALERFLSGESLPEQSERLVVATAPMDLDSIREPDLPPPEVPEVDVGVRLEGRGPSEDDVHDPAGIPWGVEPAVELTAVDNTLVLMQEEYVKLGCTEDPGSDVCKKSKYALHIQQELGNAYSN